MYDRDRLLAVVDLERLADDLLGQATTVARRRSWSCPNPQHAQTGRTPPLSVFLSRRGEQRWRCHGCGEGGTAIDLVMMATGSDVRSAMELLATRTAGVTVDVSLPTRPLPRPPDPRRLVELDAFVGICAERLWLPEGRAVRRWLTEERGLSREVLAQNVVGADLGSYDARRPDGLARAGAVAVLPAIVDGHAVYAQLRRVRPRADQPRFLNPPASTAVNPRIARFRPAIPVAAEEVVVTEGAIDALSVAAGGYRAVAVLGAAVADELVANRIAALPGRLVIAFDADEAGERGAERLQTLLSTRGRPTVRLALPSGVGDVNDWMCAAGDAWHAQLAHALKSSRAREHPLPRSIA